MKARVEAAILAAQGYAKTSNKYRMASRIDRPDWREHMAKQHAPWDWEGQGMKWANLSGMGDQYRRVYSEDTLERLPDAVFKLLPSSGGGPSTYMPKKIPEPYRSEVIQVAETTAVLKGE